MFLNWNNSVLLSGVVKKMTGGFFKIVHERHRAKNADEQIEMQIMQMQEITKLYPDLKPVLQKSTVSLIIGCCWHHSNSLLFLVDRN